MRRRLAIVTAGLASCAGLPAAAWAHGFAVRYDLPIPLPFYLAGAGCTVALSFVLLGAFAHGGPAHGTRASWQRASWSAGRVLSNPWVAGGLQVLSVALFLLVIATGLFGNNDPFRNISTTLVWVIWWVGLMLVNTFVGDVWALINPWNAVFAAAEKAMKAAAPESRLSLGRRYPERAGVWPAVLLFLAFAWLELISGEGEDPRKLAFFVLGYSALTWAGMAVYGRRAWLVHGEAFTVVFSTFARFASLAFMARTTRRERRCPHGGEVREGAVVGCHACFEDAPATGRAIVLRPPGAGLVVADPVPPSIMAIVITLLATVTFDGFFATPAWTAIYEPLVAACSRFSWWAAIGSTWQFYVVATPIFLLFPVLFAAAFLLVCRVTGALAGGEPTGRVAGLFVLTLLPIAIAYHLVHYQLYLVVTGQYIIPGLSDPFGYGWNLFGTASYKPDIGLIDARIAWYAGVAAIVAGHVIAVYVAHLQAQRLVRDNARMVASQLPMLGLMVGYTMVSLWIIAQPATQ